jgi:hypothetical protein
LKDRKKEKETLCRDSGRKHGGTLEGREERDGEREETLRCVYHSMFNWGYDHNNYVFPPPALVGTGLQYERD